MPTYQYACTECEHSFEQFQSFSEDSLTECPECHGRLRKVFNAVGVVFKGSGFYRNDSRSTTASADAPAPKSETKSESKSDTKTDKKSDSSASSTPKSDSKPAAATTA
ncbi:FmdB family zinc ribbon protein [Nocardioides sp. 503]|uniref:FmdB family zinc ribbon protein n=1 Tax=Nocardioides sp. 503 TaxID=2508326 RepID=UPI00106FCCA7|nr:FmdB family zinc ribbon protein [Nocardioides sp. 503]